MTKYLCEVPLYKACKQDITRYNIMLITFLLQPSVRLLAPFAIAMGLSQWKVQFLLTYELRMHP